jgi:hypothetical protein
MAQPTVDPLDRAGLILPDIRVCSQTGRASQC